VISIDMKNSGAGTVTPPAVGMCTAGQVVLMAPVAAPVRGTGVPFAGTATPIRLRVLGAMARPSVQSTVHGEFAITGVVPTVHASSTPGDLPPEDPLS
jgi:hypothetical protein